MNQPQAAEAMGLSTSGYRKLERGERRLTSQYISRAAAAFGVPASSIFDRDAGDLAAQRVPLERFLAAAKRILKGSGLSNDRAAELILALQEAAEADLSPLENGALLTAIEAIARREAAKSAAKK